MDGAAEGAGAGKAGETHKPEAATWLGERAWQLFLFCSGDRSHIGNASERMDAVRGRGLAGTRAARANTWSLGAGQEGVLVSWACEHLFFTLQPVFHVMGFSVTGRVLNGPEGEGVPEAVVTLNNQIKG